MGKNVGLDLTRLQNGRRSRLRSHCDDCKTPCDLPFHRARLSVTLPFWSHSGELVMKPWVSRILSVPRQLPDLINRQKEITSNRIWALKECLLLMAIFNTFLFKYISIFGSFGVRSGSVRDPFGARSRPARANFGPKFSEPKISKFQKFSICAAVAAAAGAL